MTELMIVAAVALPSCLWALISYRIILVVQRQNRDMLKVLLALAQSPPTFMQGVTADLAREMEATDRAQVEGESNTNHAAATKRPLHAAT